MKKTALKKADVILLLAVIVTAAVFFALSFFLKQGEFAVVYIDGEEVGRYALSQDTSVKLTSEGGTNVLTVKDGEAYISDADCPDLTCVRSRAVSKTGQRIICLPHKLMLVVEGKDGITEPDIK